MSSTERATGHSEIAKAAAAGAHSRRSVAPLVANHNSHGYRSVLVAWHWSAGIDRARGHAAGGSRPAPWNSGAPCAGVARSRGCGDGDAHVGPGSSS